MCLHWYNDKNNIMCCPFKGFIADINCINPIDECEQLKNCVDDSHSYVIKMLGGEYTDNKFVLNESGEYTQNINNAMVFKTPKSASDICKPWESIRLI